MLKRRAILLAVLLATLAGGCRALRGHKASDESIAAARQLSLQGIDAQQRGHWDRAEMLFAAAILKCPTDERARCGYAESLWQRGSQAEAISHMEEAVRLSGHDPERLVQLGQMYRSLGDLAQASRMAERAIAANGQLAAAWALRGEVLQAQGNRGEALASYHRALAYEPSLPAVQLAIADIYLADNRPQRALATVQEMAGSCEGGQVPVGVLFREGLALSRLGRHRDAAGVFAQAVQQSNPPPELLCELARSQMLAGETNAARQSMAAALTTYPRHLGCIALAQELGVSIGGIATASAVGERRR
jgi:tetratricopeptide (TPR) repeat protein